LAAFRRAADTYNIRADVLMAHAWLMHGFQHERRPDPTKNASPERFGVMCLTKEQVHQGAKLADLSETAVRSELEANAMAAAALLQNHISRNANINGPISTNQYATAAARLARIKE